MLSALLVSALLAAHPASETEAEEIARIRSEIAAAGLHWQAGPTKITRLSKAERRRLRMPAGTVPPWVKIPIQGQSRPFHLRPYDQLPASFDWHNLDGFDFFPTARDQGQCGDCWAFSIVGTLEGLLSIRRSVSDPTIDLSEQQLFDCATATLGCDNGGFTWSVGVSSVGGEGYVVDTGLTSETCYPYTSGGDDTRGTCTAMSGGCTSVEKADDYNNFYDTLPCSFPYLDCTDPAKFTPPDSVMTEIKTALLNGPVGTSMRAFPSLDAYSPTPGNDVYQPLPSEENASGNVDTSGSGLHAIVIVGFDDAGQYWIVRNSWSDSWGEDGYFKIAYGTSSLTMFSYALAYDEANNVPAFCPDLPKTITLQGTAPVDLKIANCGSGVLEWSAQLSPSWLRLAGSGASVTSGAEVAVGTHYQVSATQNLPAGGSGQIVLSGASNGPVTIAVTQVAEPPDAAAPGLDAAPAGPDAAPAGPDAQAPGLDAALAMAGADAAGASPGADASTIIASGADAGSTSAQHDGSQSAASADGGGPETSGGCGCSTTGATLLPGLLGLLAALAMRRRASR